MKKVITLAAALCLALTLLCGCNEDVAADLSEFRDIEMTAVNEKYDELRSEIAMWDSFTDPAELMDSVNLVILPNLAETLRLLEAIEVKTDEVEELKAMFQSGIEQYKRGYAGLLAAFDQIDEASVTDAYALLEAGESTLKVYFEELKALSAEYELDTEKGVTK